MKIGLGTIPVLGIVAVSALALVGELPGMKAENDPDISGSARVIDGDMLAIGDKRIRLAGIDAPERGQDCEDADVKAWACGAAATAWMHKPSRAGL